LGARAPLRRERNELSNGVVRMEYSASITCGFTGRGEGDGGRGVM